MTAALICVAVVALAVILFAYTQQQAHAKQQAEWAAERSELLTRIQRPELVPFAPNAAPIEIPEQKPDGWARVGEIESIDDDYGMTDDDT